MTREFSEGKPPLFDHLLDGIKDVNKSLVNLLQDWLQMLYLGTLCLLLFKVSKCSEDIKNYIEERSGEDPLVKGIPEDRNPFKEKGGCVIA
nr:guanine nucleotide-binding protein G(I)/G(S)/G(O) subunit gamma-3-like [Caretta caretta]